MGILRKIWALYGILVFFLLWLLFMPFYLIAFLAFPKFWTKYIIWFSHQVYTRIFFSLILVRFQIHGKQYIDPEKNYIIVSNHLTALDFMINARAFPGVYKYLAKKELVKVPLFGFIVKKLCVLVDRSSRSSRARSMEYLKRTIKEGYSVFLYPEGTRNTTSDPLLPFHKGAFTIAIETGVPVIVQTLVRVKHIAGKASGLDLFPGTVHVVWNEAIETSGLHLQDLEQLKEQVRDTMLRNLADYSKT